MGGAQRSASASFTAILRCFYGDLSLFSLLINRGELFNWQPWAFQRERWQAQAPLLKGHLKTCMFFQGHVGTEIQMYRRSYVRSKLSSWEKAICHVAEAAAVICSAIPRAHSFIIDFCFTIWFLAAASLNRILSSSDAQVGREGRRRRPRPDPNPTKPTALTGPMFPCRHPQFTHCLALRWTTTPTSTMTVEGKSASCRDNLVDCLFPVGEYAAKRSSEKHFYHC